MLPILVLSYNRPDKLERVLRHLAGLKREIYFAGDGSKGDEDVAAVKACNAIARRYIPQSDRLLLRNTNLGCEFAVPDAIGWFFSKVDCGVICEDDVLIAPEYFEFVDANAMNVLTNKEIYQINAFIHPEFPELHGRWFVTSIPIPWGWTTTAEKWRAYEPKISLRVSDLSILREATGGTRSALFIAMALGMAHQRKLSSWAYRWSLSVWKAGGYALAPALRLSENIGFDTSATHGVGERHLVLGKTHATGMRYDCDYAHREKARDRDICFRIYRSADVLKFIRVTVGFVMPTAIYTFLKRRFRRPGKINHDSPTT